MEEKTPPSWRHEKHRPVDDRTVLLLEMHLPDVPLLAHWIDNHANGGVVSACDNGPGSLFLLLYENDLISRECLPRSLANRSRGVEIFSFLSESRLFLSPHHQRHDRSFGSEFMVNKSIRKTREAGEQFLYAGWLAFEKMTMANIPKIIRGGRVHKRIPEPF